LVGAAGPQLGTRGDSRNEDAVDVGQLAIVDQGAEGDLLAVGVADAEIGGRLGQPAQISSAMD
jgi:hypothetical protein